MKVCWRGNLTVASENELRADDLKRAVRGKQKAFGGVWEDDKAVEGEQYNVVVGGRTGELCRRSNFKTLWRRWGVLRGVSYRDPLPSLWKASRERRRVKGQQRDK